MPSTTANRRAALVPPAIGKPRAAALGGYGLSRSMTIGEACLGATTAAPAGRAVERGFDGFVSDLSSLTTITSTIEATSSAPATRPMSIIASDSASDAPYAPEPQS